MSMALSNISKQASFFLRGKVNGVRLALTDVSPTELLAEEATNSDEWGPGTRIMAMIAKASFEREEYERIVQVLHKRLNSSSWRQLFKTLVLLEYLLLHGPYSLRDEFRSIDSRLEGLSQQKFLNEQGIDKSSMVNKKADSILELIIDVNHWKSARSHAQKNSVDINGFGSNTSKDVGGDVPTRKVLSLKAEDVSNSNLLNLLREYNRSRSSPSSFNSTTQPDDERSALLDSDSDVLQEGQLNGREQRE